MIEEWRDIPEYEGLYEVSNFGRIRSVGRIGYHPRYGRMHRKSRIMTLTCAGKYLSVCLHKQRVQEVRHVHYYVTAAFLGPRQQGAHVCHADGDGCNNRIDNLRYDTPSNNCKDKRFHGRIPVGEKSGGAKLTNEESREIMEEPYGIPLGVLAEKYGVSKATISRIRGGTQRSGFRENQHARFAQIRNRGRDWLFL